MQQKFYETYGMLRAIGILIAIFFLFDGSRLWCGERHGFTLDIELNTETAIENSGIRDDAPEYPAYDGKEQETTDLETLT